MSALWDEKLDGDAAEVHWSVGTILAIFFASSLVSAVFFGLGYSFGRGGSAKPINFSLSHAGSAAAITQRVAPVTQEHTAVPALATKAPAVLIRPEPIQTTKAEAPATALTPAVVAHSKTPAAVKTHYMVQIGSVASHRDAQLLATQLRKKGFHAGIYSARHDKFLHVQIGPFATEAQARAMRHRVMESGFRAILKQQS